MDFVTNQELELLCQRQGAGNVESLFPKEGSWD